MWWNIQTFLDVWKNISTSDCVHKWISEGVRIPLVSLPEFPNYKLDVPEALFVKEELQHLTQLRFITEHKDKLCFICNIWCLPKKAGGYRLISDLRHLNSFCQSLKFKQKDIKKVVNINEPKDHFSRAEIWLLSHTRRQPQLFLFELISMES